MAAQMYEFLEQAEWATCVVCWRARGILDLALPQDACPPTRLASLGVLSVAELEALLRCFARRRNEAACGVEVDALIWMPAEWLVSELIAGREL